MPYSAFCISASAMSAKSAAIRAVAKEDGVYVAVPKRSFRELPVKMKTETRAVVGASAPKLTAAAEA